MAIEFYSSIDLNKNELQNAALQVLSAKPGSPATGQIFFDSDVTQVQVYNGSAWVGLATEVVDTDNIFNAALKVGRDSDNMFDFATADNTIDVYLNNAKDFTFTANTFTAQSGSTIAGQVITGTTIDATTDFTIGNLVITDNTLTGTALSLAAGSGEIDLTTTGAIDFNSGAYTLNSAANTTTASGALAIVTTGAASDVSIVTAHTAGTAFHLDANANAGSIVDIDAGILDIDVTGVSAIDTTLLTLTSAGGLTVLDTTASAADQGGTLILANDDGAVMADNHRLGVIEFKGAEDTSHTLTTGARIEAICDAEWSASENGASLQFFTTDANAAQGVALTLDSNQDAAFGNDVAIAGNLTVAGTTTTENTTIIESTVTVLQFEGANDNNHETQLKVVEPSADTTFSLPALSAGNFFLPAIAGAATDASAAVTAAEFALLDGGSTIGTTAVNDNDGIVSNDGGVMRHTKVQTYQTYFDANSVGGANIVTTGALDTGTITDGFGAIDNGSSAFATGAATVASLVMGGHSVDDIDITAEFVDADAHIMSSKAIGARFAQKNADTTGTATNSVHVLVTDNENTNEENQITFIEGAGGGGAQRGLEADGHLTYNPSSGTVSATIFKGNIDAVDGDFDGTLETDALTIAGTAIVAQATASAVGGVELATAAEVLTGTDTARVVTADTLSAKSVVAVIDVSSLTDANIVTIPHNLGTADVMVQVYDITTEANVMCDIARTTDDFSTASTSSISIDFGTAPPNDCRCLITSLKGASASGTVAYT